MSTKSAPYKLVVTIVDRGKGSGILKLYASHGVLARCQCAGHGTATSEILDILGLGTKEKDILLGFSPAASANALLYALDNGLADPLHTKGIAFDARLTGLNTLLCALLDEAPKPERTTGGTPMEQTGKNSLLLVLVNQGFTEEVMETAKAAGARGGTIVRARWTDEETAAQFYGLALQAEKEVIAIVVPNEARGAIMEAINREHGLRTDAGAAVCSLAVDHFVRLD